MSSIDLTKFNTSGDLFKAHLDENSKRILELEKALTASEINIPFVSFVAIGNEYIVWDYCQPAKRYRLMHRTVGDLPIEVIDKPLVECKIEVKFRMEPYLQAFIDAFAKFIDESYKPKINMHDYHLKL